MQRALSSFFLSFFFFPISFSGMRPPCTGWCMCIVTGHRASCVNTCVMARHDVRAHKRRGMRRRISTSFLLGSTTLRTYIFPGGSPTFATIIPVAAAPARERANVSLFSAFFFGVPLPDDCAPTPDFFRVSFAPIFHRLEIVVVSAKSCAGATSFLVRFPKNSYSYTQHGSSITSTSGRW